jgi:hypothetical protein
MKNQITIGTRLTYFLLDAFALKVTKTASEKSSDNSSLANVREHSFCLNRNYNVTSISSTRQRLAKHGLKAGKAAEAKLIC